MKLRLKPLSGDIKLMYSNHRHYKQGDAGLDLFFPEDMIIPKKSMGLMVDLGIQCEGKMEDTYVPYYLYPRSSISKTPLRMANSVGIIDAGYRGNIMVALDNISDEDYQIQKGQRLFQICPWMDLKVNLEVVDNLSDSERGNNGFGSTGR
jgi:dUTP pyrophosphatase